MVGLTEQPVTTSRQSGSLKAAWVTMTVLALLVALYGLVVLTTPGFSPPFLNERRALMPWAVLAHLSGGIVAMAVGPWQLNARLRARALNQHRWMGRAYVIGVLVGGIGGLAMATVSQHGFVSHVGFGMLAVLWLFTTLQAYRHIRAGDQATHRRWMIRSYALTLAAVTLRLWIPLSQLAGIQFPDAYQVIAWLCWVPNLIVADWWLLRRNA